MSGTSHSFSGGACADSSSAPHHEHESGFLLPQLMGALASEIGMAGVNGSCQNSSEGLFSGLFASVLESLKNRLLFRPRIVGQMTSGNRGLCIGYREPK